MDEVSLATLNVVCIISAGRPECLMPHTVAPHGVAVVASSNGPDVRKMFKFSLVMSFQGIMIDLQQNVGFFSPLVFAGIQ